LLHSVVLNCVFYNKKFVKKYEAYCNEYTVAEEYFLWRKVLPFARFIAIPKYLHLMRFRKDSLSNNSFDATRYTVRQIQKLFQGQEIQLINERERNLINGWQEYFYGDRKLAREIFLKLILKLFFQPKIFFAIITTFLPNGHFNKWISLRIRFRIYNFLDSLMLSNRYYNKYLKTNAL